jgi:hypothetical protein
VATSLQRVNAAMTFELDTLDISNTNSGVRQRTRENAVMKSTREKGRSLKEANTGGGGGAGAMLGLNIPSSEFA